MGHHRLRRRHRGQERPRVPEGGPARPWSRSCGGTIAKAEDYARRHGVPRAYRRRGRSDRRSRGGRRLHRDAAVDSHATLALRVAAAGKPCLVEKPMALNHAECVRMVDAFRGRGVPLWVAYYRRALPRFLLVRDLLRHGRDRPADVDARRGARTAGARRTARRRGGSTRRSPARDCSSTSASHSLDLVDFLVGPIARATGFAVNTGGAYAAEDVTTRVVPARSRRCAGSGTWNFNADASD